MDNVILKSGTISKNEIWNGNIVIEDDIIISKGVTVTVTSNTTIKFKKRSKSKLFDRKYKLNYLIKKFNLCRETYVNKISVIVYGTLIVNGDKDGIINIGNDGWNGIIYAAPKSNLKIKYAKIRYGFGIICDVNAKTTVIDSCVIEQCCLGVVGFSKILIKKSRINYNDIGIVCFNRFIIDSSYIIDNFLCGTKIISKRGLFSKNVGALNNIGTDIFKSCNIKHRYNFYEFNNTGIVINNSNNIFCGGALVSNFLDIYVCDYSYDITVTCYMMIYRGIYVDNLSEVKIQNSVARNLDSLLTSSNYSTVNLEDTTINDIKVGVVATNNCYISAKNIKTKDVGKCFVSVLQTYIVGENNEFISKKEVFTNIDSNIYLKKTKIESKHVLCMATERSDMFFDDVHMSGAELFYIYDKTILNLNNVLFTATKKGIFSRNDAKIFITKSKIYGNDQIFELVSNSKVQIKDCELISEQGLFATLGDESTLMAEKCKVDTFSSFCKAYNNCQLYIKDSFIKNKGGDLVYAKDYSRIKIENSRIKSFSGLDIYDFCEVEFSGNYIFILNNFLSSHSDSKILLRKNNIRLVHSVIESFESSEIQMQFNNSFFVKDLKIGINEQSDIMLFNSNIVSIQDILIEYNNENNEIKNLLLRAKDVFLKMKNDEDFILRDSKIDAKLILDTNSEIVNIHNSLLKRFLFLNRKNLINIKDSEISDMIDVNLMEEIVIENSKIYGINANNNSCIRIKDSEISGEYVNMNQRSEMDIIDSKINLKNLLNVEDSGKLNIKDSEIYSIEGIRSNGDEIIYIEGSSIESEQIGMLLCNCGEIEVINSKIKAKNGIEIRSNGDEIIYIEGSSIESEQIGMLLCNCGEIEVIDSKIKAKNGIEIRNKGEIKQKGLKVESEEIGLLYANNEDISLEGIEIISQGTALRSKGKDITIIDSNIKGDIESGSFGCVNLVKSKICGEIKNSYYTNIENSNMVGKEILLSNEVNINNSCIEGKIINIYDNTNVIINNSKIYVVDGIYKNSNSDFVCSNSSICSENTCFAISGESDNIFDNVCLKSKNNYVVIANNTNLKFNNLNISARKGFLFNSNVDCKIKNSKANIFFNAFSINKTNLDVENLDIVVSIPKECFFVNTLSTVTLNNINLQVDKCSLYAQFFDGKPLIFLSGNSNLSISGLDFDIKFKNKIYFLRSEDTSSFELKDVNVSELENFLYIGLSSLGNIHDCKINTSSFAVSMYQNACLNITNTELSNLENFKFIMEDSSKLSLKNVTVHCGQFITMSKNSQVQISNSYLMIDDMSCKMQDDACFDDDHSVWNINSSDTGRYAFYLLDNAKMRMSLSDINIREIFAYCIGNSYLRFNQANILSDSGSDVLLLEDKSKTEIIDTKIQAESLAELKNHTTIVIESGFIKVKDFVINLIGDSKAFIKNTFFKGEGNNHKSAFEVSHNSQMNINNSTVDNFDIGVKYENIKNINIKSTKINAGNKILFTNDRRFLSFSNPIQKSLLYKIQQFVLSTNNIFPLNKIYSFIYIISIVIYKFFTGKKYIQSLYLRRGMLNNWIAGSSDIDYLTVLEQTDINAEYNNIFNIKKRYKKLKKIFPFYGENLIFNEKELKFYLKYGGIRSKLLKNSKLLRGKQQNLKTNVVVDLKYKIDIVKEILNSYILLSNNYFYNIDIISDICFSKAATDILKYIEYFYDMKNLDKSRISYLEEHSNDITNKLCNVLKNNVRLGDDYKDHIYNYIFNKLDELSVGFNKEVINDNTKVINIKKKDSINLFEELEEYRSDILSIILDDPGLAYIVLNNYMDKNKILSIYKKAKENYCFYNTPILFFTENMYQMLLLSNFRNNPFEFCRQRNFIGKYYERRFYISKNHSYYYQGNEIFKRLIISSLAEKSVQINEIEITRKFNEIKVELYEILVDIIQFYLFFKNDKIIEEFSSIDIVEEYKKQDKNFEKEILFLFEDNCKLKDEEGIQKIIIFIKNLKSEIVKNYEQ